MSDAPKLGFEVDTSGLTKAQQEIAKTEQATNKLAESVKKLSDGTTVSQKVWEAMSKNFDESGGKGMKAADAMTILKTRQMDAAKAALEHGAAMGVQKSAAEKLGEAIGNDINHGLNHAFGMMPGLMQTAITYGSKLLGPAGVLTVGVAGAAAAYWEFNSALAKHQDQLTTWNQKLTYAIGTQVQATATFNDLYASAQKLGVPLESMVDNFAQLAVAGRAMGASRQDMAAFADTIAKIGEVSGAKPGQVSSGVMMLSRMLSEGNVEGRQLYSLMTRFPALAQEIAKGFGVNVDQLKLMGHNGELAGTKLMDALLSRRPELDKMLDGMPVKFASATIRMGNAWDEFLAKLGQKTGAAEKNARAADLATGVLEFATHGMEDDPNKRYENAQRQYERQTRIYGTTAIGKLGPGDTAEAREADITYHANVLIAAYKKAMPALQAVGEADAAAAAEAAKMAPYNRALSIRQDRDTLGSTQDRLRNTIKDVQAGIDANPNGEKVGELRQTLGQLQAQLRQSGSAFENLTRKTRDMATDMSTWGSSSASQAFGTEVRGIMDASAKEGRAVSAGQAGVELTNQRAMRLSGETAGTLYGAMKSQRSLGLVGAGRDQTRIAEAGFAGEDWLQNNIASGATLTPRLIAALNKHIAATEAAAVAADAVKLAEAQYADSLTASTHGAVMGAIGQGSYAEREASARSQAAQDEFTKGSGYGALRMSAFSRSEGERRARSSAALDESTRFQGEQLATGGDAGAMRQAQVSERIRQATRAGSPGDADKIRAEEANRVKIELQGQTSVMREQTILARQLATVTTVSRDEETVIVALLTKQKELRSQGVDLASEEAKAVMQQTEELARANVELRNMQAKTEDLRSVFDTIGQSLGTSINAALFGGFDQGKTAAERFFNTMSLMIKKVGVEFMNAMVFNPLQKEISNGLSSFMPGFLGFGGGGAAGAGAASGLGDFIPLAASTAHTGGEIGGVHGFNTRSVSAGMFANAPRFHKGLGANEFPAILERGEQVIPRGGKAGGGMNVTNIINVTSSGDAGRDGDIIAGKVTDAMRNVARMVITDELRPGGVLAS